MVVSRGRRIGAALVCALAVAPLRAADESAKDIAPSIQRVLDAFTAISREAAEPVTADELLYQGAIPGMLRSLDPFTLFFSPEQFERLRELQNSERKGFGTVVSVLPGRVIVLQALEGSPAARAGLAGGDEILAINNIDVSYYDADVLTQLMDQSRQKEVKLHVLRAGETHPVEITMTPQMIEEPSVDRAFLLSPRIGYIRIDSFESNTGKLVKQAVEKLGGEYLNGLVLDMRDNPGGVVDAAEETAALFLSPDQLIFTIKGRGTHVEDVYVPRAAQPYSFPVAVLMNGKSASAAEIVAGALQDHDRAIVIGEPSYGKGLVQKVMQLSGGSGMALTTAFYYTPSGRSIQKQLGSGQLSAASAVAKGPFRSDAGRPLPGGGGIQPDELMFPLPLSDFQLALNASGAFTRFASDYRRTHAITEEIAATPAMLDEFRLFLVGRQIQPDGEEWAEQRTWMQERLRQALLTLELGVARGDEIELRGDPAVQLALKRLTSER